MLNKISTAFKFIIIMAIIYGGTVLARKLGIPVPKFDDRCIYDYMGKSI